MRSYFSLSFDSWTFPALLMLCVLLLTAEAFAQSGTTQPIPGDVLAKSLLKDYNGDGKIDVMAFGDSITFGTGDGHGSNENISGFSDELHNKAGYPQRIEKFLKINVGNFGLRGEMFSEGGLERFVSLVKTRTPDVVLLSEGSNDALQKVYHARLHFDFQTMINVANLHKTQVVLGTIPPICCEHTGMEPFLDSFNSEIYALAASNELPLADIHRGFRSTCNNQVDCWLLNRPEGLHPNTAGYNVMGEIYSGVILQIDILTLDGRSRFESALGLKPGSLTTIPSS